MIVLAISYLPRRGPPIPYHTEDLSYMHNEYMSDSMRDDDEYMSDSMRHDDR